MFQNPQKQRFQSSCPLKKNRQVSACPRIQMWGIAFAVFGIWIIKWNCNSVVVVVDWGLVCVVLCYHQFIINYHLHNWNCIRKRRSDGLQMSRFLFAFLPSGWWFFVTPSRLRCLALPCRCGGGAEVIDLTSNLSYSFPLKLLNKSETSSQAWTEVTYFDMPLLINQFFCEPLIFAPFLQVTGGYGKYRQIQRMWK